MAPLTNRNVRNCPETLNRPVRPCAAQAAPERGHRAGWMVGGAFKRVLNALKCAKEHGAGPVVKRAAPDVACPVDYARTGGNVARAPTASAQKSGVTWAQMARDVLITAMNRGQLPTLILMFIGGIIAWRLPPESLSELVSRVMQRLEDGTLLGWFLVILVSVFWYLHSRKMRREFDEEYKRIGTEKSKLQCQIAETNFPSSNSKKSR